MEEFKLTISAADRVVVQGQAIWCRVVGTEGARGFEARHETWLMILKPASTIDYRLADGTEHHITVQSGILNFSDGGCMILVSLE